MRAVERFCRYAAYDTQSSEASEASPSTEKQLVLAKALCEELKALGTENAHVDEYGYVYGWVPASPGCEAAPALGLIAHMDTAPAFSGAGVTPCFMKITMAATCLCQKKGAPSACRISQT